MKDIKDYYKMPLSEESSGTKKLKDYLLWKYGSVPILRGYDIWGNKDSEIK